MERYTIYDKDGSQVSLDQKVVPTAENIYFYAKPCPSTIQWFVSNSEISVNS